MRTNRRRVSWPLIVLALACVLSGRFEWGQAAPAPAAAPLRPSIIRQPQHLTVDAGTTASFSVTAVGSAPLRYQWRHDGNAINGATEPVLALQNAQVTHQGKYQVVITNSAGAVTSVVAVLAVHSRPVITNQPRSTTVVQGDMVPLSVGAAGTAPLHYQWRFGGTNLAGRTNPALALANARLADQGPYSVVVSNRFGAVTSVVAIVTVIVPPTILSQPRSLSVTAGTRVTISVVATGLPPPSYLWQFNGRFIGTRTATHTITNPQPSDSGVYRVAVSNPGGTVFSSAATLTVVQETIAPLVAIGMPRDRLRVTEPILTVTGTASDNSSVTQVVYQVNSEAYRRAMGTTNWTATLQLAPGTNQFRVYALDSAGNRSATNSRTYIYSFQSPLSLTRNGQGIVTPLADGQRLEVGQIYTVKATPASGHLFSNWISGGVASTNPTLTFAMQAQHRLVANFVPNPFPNLKGTYQGLFCAGESPAHERSGFFTFTLTDKGAFTGKLLLAGASHSFKGQFDLALQAVATIPRRGMDPVAIELNLDPVSDRVSGSVGNADWRCDLSGYRGTFHAAANPNVEFMGQYAVLASGGSDSSTPFGNGYLSLNINQGGAVKLSGVLADGSTLSQGGSLSARGEFPVYAALYRGKGSILGWVRLLDTPTNCVFGRLSWTKPNGIGGGYYPAGFRAELSALGSRYVAPVRGQPVLNVSEAMLLLDGGNLDQSLSVLATLDPLNKIAVAAPNTHKIALSITARTGLVSGSFVHPQTKRSSAIKAVLLQKQNAAAGFFLGANESGVFYFGSPDGFPLLDADP